MASPRVAYLLTQDRGGPVDVTVCLADALAATGQAEVHVFGPRPARADDADRLEAAGRHTRLEVAGKGHLGAMARARAALLDWRPDIVHAQDRRAGLTAAGLHRRRGGPAAVVHTYHGLPEDVGESWARGLPSARAPSAYSRAVLAADAALARAVRRTVVPAEAMAGFLLRRLRVPADRVVHIDNCVPVGPLPEPVQAPVRRLLFVGLLVARKGIADLLRALAAPGVMPADARLLVAGDGPERAALADLAVTNGLAGRVEFLGFRSDVAALIGGADALVLPSRLEQQPLVVAQAMALGRPVLATDTGGVARMLDVPGARRYLCPPGDVPALAGRLRELFADPDPAATGRLLARHAAAYAPSTCAHAHLALYGQLLAGRPPC